MNIEIVLLLIIIFILVAKNDAQKNNRTGCIPNPPTTPPTGHAPVPPPWRGEPDRLPK